MKIDYVSDLHFNHRAKWTENQLKWESRTRDLTQELIKDKVGDVLVIAGDFGEWNCQALWILDEVSKHYERVYFTYGNHELYLLSKNQTKKYGDSIGRINELIKEASKIKNVIPLVKTIDKYKGVTFAGDVMWYLPDSYRDWVFFNNVSNDSEYIKIKGKTIEDGVKDMWQESMDWYMTLQYEKIDVFVSHVPPIHNPYSLFEPNSLYYVDVPFMCTENWIFGHDHSQEEFTKFGVNFYTNAIGYPHELDKKFKLKTFSI